MSNYGSLVNFTSVRNKSAEPAIGLGATRFGYTDRHPFTVVEIISTDRIIVQADSSIRVDTNGMSDAQQWSFEPDPNGTRVELERGQDGRWREVEDEDEDEDERTIFVLGERDRYHDYSF